MGVYGFGHLVRLSMRVVWRLTAIEVYWCKVDPGVNSRYYPKKKKSVLQVCQPPV